MKHNLTKNRFSRIIRLIFYKTIQSKKINFYLITIFQLINKKKLKRLFSKINRKNWINTLHHSSNHSRLHHQHKMIKTFKQSKSIQGLRRRFNTCLMIKSKKRSSFHIVFQTRIQEAYSKTSFIQIMDIFWFKSYNLQKYDTIIIY